MPTDVGYTYWSHNSHIINPLYIPTEGQYSTTRTNYVLVEFCNTSGRSYLISYCLLVQTVLQSRYDGQKKETCSVGGNKICLGHSGGKPCSASDKIPEQNLRTLTVEECEALVDNLPQRRTELVCERILIRVLPWDHSLTERPTVPPIALDIELPNISALLTGPLYPRR